MTWSLGGVKEILERRAIRLKKRLGQSFLVDDNFLEAIPRLAGVRPEDGVIEIGTGLGNLTEHLAAKAAHVWSFEIDRDLHRAAVEQLNRKNVTLVHADGATFEKHVRTRKPLRVVANLPYSDYRRLLLRLLSTELPIESYTLMVQADVHDRMRAKPGTKDYGPLAVMVQGTCSVKQLRRAGKSLFYPRPRVDSVLMSLVRERREDLERIDRVLRGMFAQRRKKFRHWLRKLQLEDSPLAEYRVGEVPPNALIRIAAGSGL